MQPTSAQPTKAPTKVPMMNRNLWRQSIRRNVAILIQAATQSQVKINQANQRRKRGIKRRETKCKDEGNAEKEA